jgi:hypothetical protein
MKYRHERMIRDREARTRQRLQQEVEAVLRDGLTEDEARLWQLLSEAVGRIRVD